MLCNEDEFRENLAAILEGGTMNFTVDESMSYQTCVVSYLFSLNVSHSRRIRVSDMSMSQLWTLIYYAGYLTIVVNCLYIPSLRLHSTTSRVHRHSVPRNPVPRQRL